MQILLVVHLLAKIGWQANDAVTQLKMVEKGLGREDLAVTVLIDFPFQIVGGWLAGKWSRGEKPLRAWIYSFWPRLALTLLFTLMVYWFPKPPISAGFFVLLVTATIAQSFAGCVLRLIDSCSLVDVLSLQNYPVWRDICLPHPHIRPRGGWDVHDCRYFTCLWWIQKLIVT